MGYRCQVGLVIGKETYHEKSTSDLKVALGECDKITEDDNAYFFTWDSVKWYPDYKAVQVIEKFVEENEEDSGLVIIGEELEDNVTKGSPYNFDLSIVREVYIPESKEIKNEDFFANNAVKFIKKI